jgi:prephenate dehydrogenase
MSWLQSLGLLTIIMLSDKHDEHLAETLFLTHYVGQIVAEAGFDRTTIDTVSFGFLMDAVESVKNDRQLFLDVWRYNPYCKAMITKFHQAQKNIEGLLI